MMMTDLFHKGISMAIAFSTALAAPLMAGGFLPGMTIADDGTVRIGAISIGTVVSETGNVPTLQGTTSFTAEKGYPLESDGSYETRGVFTIGRSKKKMPFTQTIQRTAAGTVFTYHITDLPPEVIDVRLAFRVPIESAKGKAVTLNGNIVALPIEGDAFMLVYDTKALAIAFPCADGDLLVKGSFSAFLQDRRKNTKQDWFESRLSFTRTGTEALLTVTMSIIAAGSAAIGNSGTAGYTVEKNVSYLGDARAEKMDIYLPESGNGPFPLIIDIHGGGWSGGDKADRRETQICETMARAGFAAASINYLLSASGKPSWPTNVHDCKTAIKYLRVNAARYRIDPENIGVIGGSAGGHLSMLMAWTGDDARLDPPAYPGVSTRVKAVVDLYGVPDIRNPISKSTRASGEGWIGKKADEAPELFALLSPITHVAKNAAPVFILHGTKDVTVPLEHSEALVAALNHVGARYTYSVIENAPHTFYITSTWGDFSTNIITFFKEYLR